MKNTRTRWLYAVGAPVACAAVVIAGTVAANAAMSPRPAAAPAADLQFGAPAPAKSAPASSAPDPSAAKPLGDVISTGIAAKTGKWVFFAQAIDEKALPQTHFGIMAGHRLPSGELAADVMANEVKGSDRAPGFHAVQGGMQIDAGKSPTFGYYVGSATKITAQAGGHTVTAKHAVWSEDPSVVVFWFDPAVSGIGKLAAYDKAGKKLTTGNAGIGVG
jgi:hypothetical protein